MILGIKQLLFCELYILNKAYKQHNKNPVCHQAKAFLKQIHIDLCNKGETFSIIKNYYFCIFTDNVIKWRDILFFKMKIEVKAKLFH